MAFQSTNVSSDGGDGTGAMEEKRPSDTIRFPVTEMQRAIADTIAEMTGPRKWPAFNSLRHLNRAWDLRNVDLEMALFRGITAEEEAATALLRSVQAKEYTDATKLNPRDHVQKGAVIPLFDAIAHTFAEVAPNLPRIQIELDREKSPPLLRTLFVAPWRAPDGSEIIGEPQPPLHFSLKRVKASGEEAYEDFGPAFDHITRESNVREMMDHIRTRANQRNLLLYAGASCYYSTSSDRVDDAIMMHVRATFRMLTAFLLVEPYPKQNFVQQALFAFLKILKKQPADLTFL